MKTKHTARPWKTERLKACTIVYIGDSELTVETANHVADAALIAAAPEMLEFIEAVLAEQERAGEYGDAEYISRCRAIIAKVEGKE
jgi:hypothetical protein